MTNIYRKEIKILSFLFIFILSGIILSRAMWKSSLVWGKWNEYQLSKHVEIKHFTFSCTETEALSQGLD